MVELQELHKRFGQQVVLAEVSARWEPGRVYGLWGRNGSGKSTLLRLVAGLLVPDRGRVRVLGQDPARHWPLRQQLGIVEDADSLFPELTAGEFLWWVGRLRGLKESRIEEQSRQYLGALHLGDRAGDLTGTWSHGMRRKLCLAGALMGPPRILLLDEPTVGLDADSLAVLSDLLLDHARAGGLVVLASHDRHFVQATCTEVCVLERCRLSAAMTVAEALGLDDLCPQGGLTGAVRSP